MADPTRNNPAERLLRLIGALSTQKGSAIHGWASALGLDPSDIKQPFRAAYLVSGLIAELDVGLQSQKGIAYDRFKPMLAHLRNCFTKHDMLHNPSTQAFQYLTSSSVIEFLGFASDALHAVQPEETITPEDMEEISGVIKELRHILADKDLDSDLRVVVGDLVDALERALIEYKTRGIVGLQKALAYIIGVLIMRKDKLVGSPAYEPVKRGIGRLVMIMSRAPTWGMRILVESKLAELAAGLPPHIP